MVGSSSAPIHQVTRVSAKLRYHDSRVARNAPTQEDSIHQSKQCPLFFIHLPQAIMTLFAPAVHVFVRRPLSVIVGTACDLCQIFISCFKSRDLNAVQIARDFADFYTAWEKLKDFEHGDKRSLDQVAIDYKYATLWTRLARRNKSRVDAVQILEQYLQAHKVAPTSYSRLERLIHPREAAALSEAYNLIMIEKYCFEHILSVAVAER